jgi:hypothetical protein
MANELSVVRDIFTMEYFVEYDGKRTKVPKHLALEIVRLKDVEANVKNSPEVGFYIYGEQ